MRTNSQVLSLGPSMMLPTLNEGCGMVCGGVLIEAFTPWDLRTSDTPDKHSRTSVWALLLIEQLRCWRTNAIFLFKKIWTYVPMLADVKKNLKYTSNYWSACIWEVATKILSLTKHLAKLLRSARPCFGACPPRAHFQQESGQADLAGSWILDIWSSSTIPQAMCHRRDLPSARILLGWFS